MKKLAMYSTVLIGLYLFVDHATGGAALFSSGATAVDGTIKAFQGR
jgi:hypothetical protein